MDNYENEEKDNVKEERFYISPDQEVYIESNVSNINIYGIYEDIARIRYSDRFTIDYGNNATHIYESLQEPKSDRKINMNGSSIICSVTSNIFISNGNVTIVNGPIINNSDLDIFLPKSFKTYNFIIKSKNGNVIVSDISMARLDIECKNGNIKLYNMEVLMSSLVNKNGNVQVEINDYKNSYDTNVYSKNGRARIMTQEDDIYKTVSEKRILNATSKHGNVKVLFKGKR